MTPRLGPLIVQGHASFKTFSAKLYTVASDVSAFFVSAAYAQLLEEDNQVARAGVIAAGGVLGLLIGSLRGRFFKKLTYTTLGLGGGAALCYPQEAREIGNEAYAEAKRYGTIGVNFVQGGMN